MSSSGIQSAGARPTCTSHDDARVQPTMTCHIKSTFNMLTYVARTLAAINGSKQRSDFQMTDSGLKKLGLTSHVACHFIAVLAYLCRHSNFATDLRNIAG